MRIVELTVMHLRTPLRRVVRHASYTRRANDTLIVRCRLDDGSLGWGEGLPRPYVTGETIESAFAQFDRLLENNLPGNDLLGAPCEGPQELAARLRGWRIPRLESGQRDCFGNALRCAVELSVLDAAGRAWRRPIVDIVLQEAARFRLAEPRERVQYSAALSASGWWQTTARCWLYRRWDFQHYKVKVGLPRARDGARLQLIRRLLGAEVDVRVDANEAWTPDNLEQRIASLRPARVSAVEQPLPHEQVGALRLLRPRLGVPIVLDESLCSLSDAHRAVEEGLCDIFNLRLSKCGGLLPAVELAATARDAGLEVQLGCQVGESGILSAAGRAFACSVAGLRWVEGSFDRLLAVEPLTAEDITFGRGGWARVLQGPGLGVTVDAAAIARLTLRSSTLSARG